MALAAYRFPLSPVTSFKYLGRVLAAEEYNWPEVVSNLQCAIKKWVWLTRILSTEGADARTSGQIYLALVQFFMLYRSDTWVLTPRMKRVPDGFHHRVARRLAGRQPWRGRDGGLFYPLMEYAMAEAVL